MKRLMIILMLFITSFTFSKDLDERIFSEIYKEYRNNQISHDSIYKIYRIFLNEEEAEKLNLGWCPECKIYSSTKYWCPLCGKAYDMIECRNESSKKMHFETKNLNFDI